MKDFKAGKLDACTQLEQFVGYDLESKGFHIYWPAKCLVTVKRKVIFNDSDVVDTIAVIHGDLSEGRRRK